MTDFGNEYHTPVMWQECVDGLGMNSSGIYIDVTFGGGGHSRALLSMMNEKGRLYAFDQDADAVQNLPDDPRIVLTQSNFRYLAQFADFYGITGKVNGIIADLGVSSHHFDEASRGFSFRSSNEAVDMRMNTSAGHSAQQLLMTYEESRLADVLFNYGELRQSHRLARRIVEARPLEGEPYTVGRLLEAVKPEINPREEKKQLGMLFQALRIEVNDEMGALRELLDAAFDVLAPGGRLAVLTYHSLEDRIVKKSLKETVDAERTELTSEIDVYGKKNLRWKMCRKVMKPSQEEVERNPRARSAKLRVAEAVK